MIKLMIYLMVPLFRTILKDLFHAKQTQG